MSDPDRGRIRSRLPSSFSNSIMPEADRTSGVKPDVNNDAERILEVKVASINCAECRRLKLKCDRTIPCSSCVRRQCAELCPDEVKATRRSEKDEKEFVRLQDRIRSLEDALGARDQTTQHPPPPTHVSSSRKRRLSESDDLGWQHQPSASPQNWNFANTLAQSTRIPTPPSYRYHENVTRPARVASSLASTSQGPFPVEEDGSSAQSTEEQSHGTLVIDKSGRSRYFGATAGTEWLKNQEVGGDDISQSTKEVPNTVSFPFASPRPTLSSVLSRLPPLEEAQSLVDSYFRYYAWLHDPAPRNTFQPVFDKAYRARSSKGQVDEPVYLQQLALIFAVLAVGSHHNLETPANDTGAEEFVSMSKMCLTADDFLNHNTMAGIQTVLILGHYCLETEQGRTGDAAWPLWGIASRQSIAMGLHRDGERWNLPDAIVQERRVTFWETFTIDCLQANCFSRPGVLSLRHIDTAFPVQDPDEGNPEAETFFLQKFRIARFSARLIDQGMATGHRSYESVNSLYQELCQFELSIPFHLRCRTSLLALPSVYPDPDRAKQDSPDLSRRNLKRTLQQFTLSLNVAETILGLQRPYFVMALNENAQDPTRSKYAVSYLATVERCNAIIQIVATLFELYPACLSRHWFFHYHSYNSALILSTLILRHPHNVLADFARGQIDVAISCYAALLRGTSSKTLQQNYDWLVKLRARCSVEAPRPVERTDITPKEERDVELLGWRTRLVERTAEGSKATTISGPTDSRSMAPLSLSRQGMLPTADQVLQQHQGSAFGTDVGMVDVVQGVHEQEPSMDMLLHQFWDPLIDAGDTSTVNWWNWDGSLE